MEGCLREMAPQRAFRFDVLCSSVPVLWQTFPRSARTPVVLDRTIQVFQVSLESISSNCRDLSSDRVLQSIASELSNLGYSVETGKRIGEKIEVPVLFGLNGRVDKCFNADAFHSSCGIVLEVEAGRALVNNQILKDLFQACMMQDAKHLAIAVRQSYRGSNDFEKACIWFDTLFASQRLRLPLETVTLIGY